MIRVCRRLNLNKYISDSPVCHLMHISTKRWRYHHLFYTMISARILLNNKTMLKYSHHPSYNIMPLTTSCLLQHYASYNIMPLTTSCLLQHYASYNIMPLTQTLYFHGFTFFRDDDMIHTEERFPQDFLVILKRKMHLLLTIQCSFNFI